MGAYLIDLIGGVDVLVLDNVMSLLDGVQKEEEAWTGANPLVASLSRRQIAQIWLDHTGHAGDKQYGTSTKSWRFDAVGVMTPVKQLPPTRSASFLPLIRAAARQMPAPNTRELAEFRKPHHPIARRSLDLRDGREQREGLREGLTVPGLILRCLDGCHQDECGYSWPLRD